MAAALAATPLPPAPLSVSISGPSTVNGSPMGCTWTALASGGTGNYSYTWSGVLSGTQSTVWGTIFNPGSLNLSVFDGSTTRTASKFISVDFEEPDC